MSQHRHIDNFTSLDEPCWQDGCGRQAMYRCNICEWPFCLRHARKHSHVEQRDTKQEGEGT